MGKSPSRTQSVGRESDFFGGAKRGYGKERDCFFVEVRVPQVTLGGGRLRGQRRKIQQLEGVWEEV